MTSSLRYASQGDFWAKRSRLVSRVGKSLVLRLLVAHQAVLVLVSSCLTLAAPRNRATHVITHFNFAEVASPVAYFPTRMMVDGDIGRTRALTGRSVPFPDLALHVPIPLVDLGLLQAQQVLELDDFGLGPVWVLLELDHKDFILLSVLSQPFLCFLSAFDTVADNDSWHIVRRQSSGCLLLLTALWRVFACALNDGHGQAPVLLFLGLGLRHGRSVLGKGGVLLGVLFFSLVGFFTGLFAFLGALKGSCVLLEGGFGSFLQQGVDTLVQVLRRHVIVDDAEAWDVNSALVALCGDFLGLEKLALLLDELNVLSGGATL